MRLRTLLYGSLAIVAAGLLAACSDDPAPTSPTKLTPSPFAAIEVTGPDSIAPSQAAQFVANIRQTDGTTKWTASLPDLRWSSSNPSVVRVSTTGVVTAGSSAFGEAVITADLMTQPAVRGTREVVVQPEGTYRIGGSVREADAPTVPIAGARVEVLPGSNFTLTDSTGQYRLYGVPPQSSIRITAAGYETLEQPLELSSNVTREFGLNPDGSRPVLNGPYTISVDTASPCSLNSALQHRTYDAVLSTTGTTVDVLLTEPRFLVDSSGRGNRFRGRVVSGGATFTLEFPDTGEFQHPNLLERLADNTYLIVEGVAATTGTAAGFTGTLNGSISNWDSRFPGEFHFLGNCYASNIQFRVTPK
jgi:hypothetical protein